MKRNIYKKPPKNPLPDPLIVKDEFANRFLDELNLCRKDPQKYSIKLRSYESMFDKEILRVPSQTAIKTKEGYSAFEEAAMFLDNMDELPPLKLSAGFSCSARDALNQLQSYNRMDEIAEMKIDECLGKFGEVYGPFAQCCDFGTDNPEFLVVMLLADDGDENRANRLSLLNPNFKVVGFSYGPHEIYGCCNVVMLARHFYSLNEKPTDDSSGDEEDQKEKEINEEDKMYFEKKINGKSKRLERIVEKNGLKKKLIKDMKIKNGVLFTDIFYEEIS